MIERIERVIQQYDAQGIHRTGTTVDNDGADWLGSALEAGGAEVRIERFDFDRLDIRRAGVLIGNDFIPGIPAFDGGRTSEAGIGGILGEPGSSAPIAVCDVLPFDASEGARRLMSLRETGEHAGLIALSDDSVPPGGPALLNAEHYLSPFGPPVLQIGAEHRDRIRGAVNAGASVTFVCDTHRTATTAANVSAVLAGTARDLAPLVVMTPRSGWWRCASERGGGIAALIEVVHALAELRPARDVIFTANTGHELGHVGLEHFLAANPSLPAEAHCWIHFGANFAAAKGPGVRLQFSDAELREQVHGLLGDREPDVETPLGSRPVGEARNVHDGGGRYVSIVGGNALFHHPADIYPDAVDIDKTRDWTRLFVRLAVQLAGG